MSVTATFRREGMLVIETFTDHLGNQYSQTHTGINLTDVQLQARADAAAADLEQRLADGEAEQVLS